MPDWPNDQGAAEFSPLRAFVTNFPVAAAHISGDRIWLNSLAEEIVGYRASELATLEDWGNAVHRTDEPPGQGRVRRCPERRLPSTGGADDLSQGWNEASRRIQRLPRRKRRGMGDAGRDRRPSSGTGTARPRAATPGCSYHRGSGYWKVDLESATMLADTPTRRLFGMSDQPGSDSLDECMSRVPTR